MDKRLKKNTENRKVKSLKSALSPPPLHAWYAVYLGKEGENKFPGGGTYTVVPECIRYIYAGS